MKTKRGNNYIKEGEKLKLRCQSGSIEDASDCIYEGWDSRRNYVAIKGYWKRNYVAVEGESSPSEFIQVDMGFYSASIISHKFNLVVLTLVVIGASLIFWTTLQ